ncbi:MAG: CYTH domain-containing protein [Desulfovibrionaceae bacterium]|nr:CYTH domain-containing protein [Desulfovibrionaceae bacterium]
MPKEIERKFLPANDDWRGLVEGVRLCQGYLSTDDACAVRVRIAGDRAWVGIKGKNTGATRLEFEYPVPLKDARQMLESLAKRPLIEKTRYAIPFAGLNWEVDEFHGDNQGLIIIEVELEDEAQTFVKPHWAGLEVTGDPRYYNSNLVAHPFKSWPCHNSS